MSGIKSRRPTSKNREPIKGIIIAPVNAALMKEHDNAFDYFVNRIQDYEVVFSTDGNYYDLAECKPHTRNEISCLLRWDYINNNVGSLTGKALQKSIDRFLTAAEETFRSKMSSPEDNEFVLEQDGFMKRFVFPPAKNKD